MKRTLMIAVLLILPVSIMAAEKRIIELGVQGMSCQFCAINVKKKLNKIPGINNAEVSLKEEKATIEITSGQKIDLKTLKKTISELGFTPGKVTGDLNE